MEKLRQLMVELEAVILMPLKPHSYNQDHHQRGGGGTNSTTATASGGGTRHPSGTGGSRADPREFDPETWETNNYRIFDPSDIPHGTIDIPVWAQNTRGYSGSLAHKCNHSFTPNGQFVIFDHPKFGLIPCVSTIKDVVEGEEVSFQIIFKLKHYKSL